MKSVKLFFLSALTLPVVSLAQCLPEHHAPVPNLVNLSYHEARKLLIDAGWQPSQNAMRDDFIASGNSTEFLKKGYSEIESCAGTGMAPCAFIFSDTYGNTLRVISLGVEDPNGQYQAHISNVQFICN